MDRAFSPRCRDCIPSTYETFVIEKKNATGTIGSGDLVALRSQATGKYIIAPAAARPSSETASTPTRTRGSRTSRTDRSSSVQPAARCAGCLFAFRFLREHALRP
jgi:hypothetical protein